ncbi:MULTISPECIES: hypothetical protein [unclassified Methylococcus]|uniref:hypothetical protein n=1 Tax=unclassified Methylococcus TaxID=2618889 RepID=UPI003D7EFE1F
MQVEALPPMMTIPEFCRIHRISKAMYYKFAPEQRPRTVRVGAKPLISAAAAQEWAARLEAAGAITAGSEAA